MEKIRDLHGLSDEEIDSLLVVLTANAIWNETPGEDSVSVPDPGNDHLWHLLRSARGALLVTGDRLLLDYPTEFALVISPRFFMGMLWVLIFN